MNIVGDHATHHTQYDAQLQSDIETVARNCSTWVRTSPATAQLPADVAEAVSVAIGPPAQISTLILPADVSWSEGATALPAPSGKKEARTREAGLHKWYILEFDKEQDLDEAARMLAGVAEISKIPAAAGAPS